MGLGLLELVIIAVAALVLLGPDKLPEVLRQLGRLYVHLRRTSNEFRGVFDHMVRQAEEELRLNEIKRLTDLANQGSKIAQNATDQLQKMDPYHPTHDPHHDQQHAPAVTESAPTGRHSHAVDMWDHPTSHLPFEQQPAPAAPVETQHHTNPPETKP